MERLHGFVEWLGRWGKIVLAVLGAILAFGSAYWASLVEDDPTLQYWLFGIGIIGTGLAVTMPISEARASHRRITELEEDLAEAKREGRQELLLVVDFVIRPLLEKLGILIRIELESAKNLLAAELKVLALSALKEVIGPKIPQLRANYFKLRYSSSGRGPYLQEPVSTATAPRQRFDLGDMSPESEAIFYMLVKTDYVFTPDCVEEPPVGFDTSKERAYRTFISASAYDGEDVDGMISVDSPEAGSLTEADAKVVQLVGTIIAISEAIRDGKR